MKRIDCIKRDNLLVDFLLDHKGRENAVNRYKIADYLTANGYSQNAGTIHLIIAKLIKERHLPICSVNSKGYFWAKTKADIVGCIEEMQGRITALQEHIEHLKHFVME